MHLNVLCPRCSQPLTIPATDVGKVVACQACGQKFQVAAPDDIPAVKENDQQPAVVGPTFVSLLGWLSLALAVLLSVAAAIFPIVGLGGTLASYAIASLAIAIGLATLLVSFVTDRSIAASAAITLFLGVVALLFSINFKVANGILAKASAVRQEREEANEAKRAAAEMVEESGKTRAKAEAVMQSAEELRALAAKSSEQNKAEQRRLNNENVKLSAERTKIEAANAELEVAKNDLENRLKEVRVAREMAAERAKKVETDSANATRLWDNAEKRAKEAEALMRRVNEATSGIKSKLKANSPTVRSAAIKTLARIGDPACAYELCEVVVSDPVLELKREAHDAIEILQPGLHPLVTTLILPPEGNVSGEYVRALKQLPAFGNAGLPLIESQMQGRTPGVKKLSVASLETVLQCHAETLAKIANESDVALKLLVALADSPLAIYCSQQRQFNDDLNWPGKFRKGVGESLLRVTSVRAEARRTVLPFFVALLGSKDAADRVFGANSLADFGQDAISVLPALKQLKSDESARVRNAVTEAIAKIERAAK
jgi:uncharacterized protein (DUF983 family)